MKQLTLTLAILIIGVRLYAVDGIKSVNLSLTGNGIKEDYVPCGEAFNINVPSTYRGGAVTDLILTIYDTYGKSVSTAAKVDPANKDQTVIHLPDEKIKTEVPKLATVKGKLIAGTVLEAADIVDRDNNFTKLITTSNLYSGSGTTLHAISYYPTNVPVSGEDYIVYIGQSLVFKRGYILVCKFNYTIGGVSKSETLEVQVYSTATKNELAIFEAFTSIGPSFFSTQYNTGKNIGVNPMIITGVKLRFRPTSTNPKIGDYGLFPKASRFSFVFGLTLSQLQYKNSEIKGWGADFVKPTIGFEADIWKVFGLQIGCVFAQQVSSLPTNSFKKTVAAPYISMSLSADLFAKLRPKAPATSNTQQ